MITDAIANTKWLRDAQRERGGCLRARVDGLVLAVTGAFETGDTLTLDGTFIHRDHNWQTIKGKQELVLTHAKEGSVDVVGVYAIDLNELHGTARIVLQEAE